MERSSERFGRDEEDEDREARPELKEEKESILGGSNRGGGDSRIVVERRRGGEVEIGDRRTEWWERESRIHNQ